MAISRRPSSAIRQHNWERRTERTIEEVREFRVQATRGGCVMCRAHPVDPATRRAHYLDLLDIQAHHIIDKSHLKAAGKHEYIWDVRNGLGLCGYHHPRHTHWRQRVPRELLPQVVYDFAREVGLEWRLDQYLPA